MSMEEAKKIEDPIGEQPGEEQSAAAPAQSASETPAEKPEAVEAQPAAEAQPAVEAQPAAEVAAVEAPASEEAQPAAAEAPAGVQEAAAEASAAEGEAPVAAEHPAEEEQPIDPKTLYDAVIIGGGPAGLTAAMYLARARYRVIVVEKDRFGGQIAQTGEVVNYPGQLSVSGADLGETMRLQAECFGAEFLKAEATGLDIKGDVKRVQTTRGELTCLSVLMATGASPSKVGFEGEDEFRGHGVAYCATCDGEFFTDKEVFVVGGGLSAADESLFLTKYARHITILVRKGSFSCPPLEARAAMEHEKIDVLFNTEVVKVEGDSLARSITYKNNKTGEETTYTAEEGDNIGVFVFVGNDPASSLVRGIAKVNAQGYILKDAKRRTSVKGLFAAGDVCVKDLRQVATAVGEGAEAASDMEHYCKEAQERTGLVPPLTEVNPARARAEALAKINAATVSAQSSKGSLFDDDMLAQLNTVFERMESPVVLRVFMDTRAASDELRDYVEELAGLSDKVSAEIAPAYDPRTPDSDELPCVQICRADGTPSGLTFHGVPGGHEFTSFVLGMYNVAGPGQPIDDADRADIAAIDKPTNLKVLVSLSCTMCPETVTAAQRIAAENPLVTCDVYDVSLFPKLKERYNVMSVPCLVVNDGELVSFGKRNLAHVLALIS